MNEEIFDEDPPGWRPSKLAKKIGIACGVLLLLCVAIVALAFSREQSRAQANRREYTEKTKSCGRAPIGWVEGIDGNHRIEYNLSLFQQSSYIQARDKFYCTFTELYANNPGITRDAHNDLKKLQLKNPNVPPSQIQAYE